MLVAGCAFVLLAKLALIWRIDVNWDEFFFLSHVHSLLRGDLVLPVQGAYVHFFRWLPAVSPNEVDQVVAARIAIWLLFVVATVLLWRLARVWMSQLGATAAILSWLTALPVLLHGASFRANSLIAPILVDRS